MPFILPEYPSYVISLSLTSSFLSRDLLPLSIPSLHRWSVVWAHCLNLQDCLHSNEGHGTHRQCNYKQKRTRRHGKWPQFGRRHRWWIATKSRQAWTLENWQKTRGSKSVMEAGQKLKASIIFRIPSLDYELWISFSFRVRCQLQNLIEFVRILGI